MSALGSSPQLAWIANGDVALDAVAGRRCCRTAICCRRRSTSSARCGPAARRAHDPADGIWRRPAGSCSNRCCRAIRRSRRSRCSSAGSRRTGRAASSTSGSTRPAPARCCSPQRALPAFDPAAQRAALAALERAFAATDHAAGADARGQRHRQLLGADGDADAHDGADRRHRRHDHHAAPVAGRLPQRGRGRPRRAAARHRGSRRPRPAVGAMFGAVHGITLAFGFTLIGVAQDYPLHLLSHRRADRAPARDRARGSGRRLPPASRAPASPISRSCSPAFSASLSWRCSP